MDLNQTDQVQCSYFVTEYNDFPASFIQHVRIKNSDYYYYIFLQIIIIILRSPVQPCSKRYQYTMC